MIKSWQEQLMEIADQKGDALDREVQGLRPRGLTARIRYAKWLKVLEQIQPASSTQLSAAVGEMLGDIILSNVLYKMRDVDKLIEYANPNSRHLKYKITEEGVAFRDKWLAYEASIKGAS